jgi:hypothetical protein
MPEEKPDKELTASVERFFAALQQGKDAEAWTGLLADSPLRAQAKGVESLKKQANTQLVSVGTILGFELMTARSVGSALVVLKYLVKHEQEATTWAFAFYKPKDRWLLTGLRWFPSAAYLVP